MFPGQTFTSVGNWKKLEQKANKRPVGGIEVAREADRQSGWRGRASQSKRVGRYERHERVDGAACAQTGDTADPPARAVPTRIHADRSRTIIATNRSPDISFDRSINPYRGCEHGCAYCYARPSHAWLGHSPGLDFETEIYAKHDAATLLEAALRKPGYRPAPLALGANTDPYQPAERTLGITRAVLQVLARFDHPVVITTKGALVTRDLDLLAPMAAKGLAKVAVSVTTLDPRLARAMEPRASTPTRRLEAIGTLTAAGIPVSVMAAPIIPGLNDQELEAILEAAAGQGARGAGYVALRLPLEIKDLFREWLETTVPDRAARVISLTRQMRGGQDYDARWRVRQTGTGPLADLLAARMARARRRFGLETPAFALDCSRFHVPDEDQFRLL